MSYTQDLLNLAMEANGIVAGITANTTAISSISVGNSTVNSTINSTALSIGSNTATFGTTFYSVANGNVGIGTSTPGTKLNVYSASAINTYIRTQNTLGYIDIGPLSDGSVYGGYAAPAGGTGFTVGTSTSSYWRVLTNGAERMRIDSAGLVGIGTSSPTGLFNVTASANDSFLLRGHLNLADGVSLYSVDSLNSVVKGMEFAASLFYFNSGPVGIGTASPTYAFDTQNSSTAVDYIAGRFLSAAAATGESRTWLKIEKASTYGGAIGGYLSQAVGSGLILGTQNGVATPVERMRITNAGNVGIGTTTPNAPLDVTKVDSSTTIGSSLSVVKVNNNSGTLNATSGVEFFHGNDTSSNIVRLAGVYGVYTSYNAAGLGGALAFATNTPGDATIDERMRIDSAGNVGIGNTAPGSKLTISGGVSSFEALLEKATVSATAATGTVHLDALTQAVLYYTSNATANFTLNVRANSSVTANSILVNGQSLTVAFLNTTGATAYYPNVFSIDSTTVTPKYSGGTAYVAGNANSVDSYTFTIIKTANSTYTVLANQTQYK